MCAILSNYHVPFRRHTIRPLASRHGDELLSCMRSVSLLLAPGVKRNYTKTNLIHAFIAVHTQPIMGIMVNNLIVRHVDEIGENLVAFGRSPATEKCMPVAEP